ncbi:ubiquinol-cytochrome c reductase iron-sulfur subunit [Deinococcus lacus]|uniref:Ubiquinol-cytochrome c reductase iron-sulfur subunit n=1 Tax=Deinococcus lacus TaxID=392561 RepID=A0ABW1YBN0_9DEIO
MTRYKSNDPELTRRKFVNIAMGTTATVGVVSLLSTLGSVNPVFKLTPGKMPPMEGDILVHAEGDKAGQPIALADLGETLTPAWPMGQDADGNPVIRKAEPNNLLAVYAFPSGQLGGETKLEATIDGSVVAYSDICTHAGCPVPDAKDGNGMFCPCHSGQYAPKEGAIVKGGPPQHKLAQLPIKADGDKIVVTDFFLSPPFGYTTEEAWEAYLDKVRDAAKLKGKDT